MTGVNQTGASLAGMEQKPHLVVIGIAIIVMCASSSVSQDRKAASLAFDVTSIKPANPNDLRKFIDIRNGRFVAKNRTIKELMTFGYGLQALQVSGGPDWADSEGFDIEAKSETNPTAQQFREMIQALLTERFHLSFHRETKQMNSYALVVDRGSPRLGPVVEQTLAAVNRVNRGYLQGQRQTLAGLAFYFSTMLSRIVVDRTGIAGAYNFTLQWRPDPGELCPSCNLPLTVNEQLPDLFTALREQLGLKLEPMKEPVEILVIDHVEKPTEN